MFRKLVAAFVAMAVMALLLLLFFLSVVPHSHAQGGSAKSKICDIPLELSSSRGDSNTGAVSTLLIVVSECREIPLDQMRTFSPELRDSVAEWRKILTNPSVSVKKCCTNLK